jgi:hypothetical protein
MPFAVLAQVGWLCAATVVANTAIAAVNAPTVASPIFVNEISKSHWEPLGLWGSYFLPRAGGVYVQNDVQ